MKKQDQGRRRIIEAAREKFFRFGFSRVTMDEIALECRVSKKTLYKHFPGKEVLLREVIHGMMKNVGKNVDQIVNDSSLELAERLQRLMVFIGMLIAQFNRPFVQDIRMYAPELWKEVEKFRREKVLQNFGKSLKEGVDKGLFRKDINPDLLLTIYLSAMESLLNPEAISSTPFSAYEIFQGIVRVIFEGMLTDKAKSLKLSEKLLPANQIPGGGL